MTIVGEKQQGYNLMSCKDLSLQNEHGEVIQLWVEGCQVQLQVVASCKDLCAVS